MLNSNSILFVNRLLKYSNKKIPINIKIKSDKEQIKQTKNTYCFLRPCSITNIFCAPIANMRLNPVKKPNIKNSICIFNNL